MDEPTAVTAPLDPAKVDEMFKALGLNTESERSKFTALSEPTSHGSGDLIFITVESATVDDGEEAYAQLA